MLVKTKFSIKDLENLSGIKAHTIRIWEKRYDLLNPSRSETNIRAYNLDSLKRLLNISFLYENGYKISKIADLSKEELSAIVAELGLSNEEAHSINTFKTAMFQFNQQLFAETYQSLLENKSFEAVFTDVFIPLLTQIGVLWQTGTIDPCHERFVSEMVKQKIVLHIEQQYVQQKLSGPPTLALFLPYREIHDIGLMYANYLCVSHGINTIYLGSNISLHSLQEVINHHENIIFLTYLTVEPSQQNLVDFCEQYNSSIGIKANSPLWLMGSKIQDLHTTEVPENVRLIKDIPELTRVLKNLKKG